MPLNVTTASPVIIALEPWRADLYRRSSLAAQAHSVAFFNGPRVALERKGNAAAAASTAVPIRIALLKLAGADATTRRTLERKVAIRVEPRWAWLGHPLSAVVIESAIVADGNALTLGRDQEQRLLQRLPGEA